jgi:hypothetical protein
MLIFKVRHLDTAFTRGQVRDEGSSLLPSGRYQRATCLSAVDAFYRHEKIDKILER